LRGILLADGLFFVEDATVPVREPQGRQPPTRGESQMTGLPASMRDEFGSDMVLRDISRPTPGPGHVLVRIAASGVNPLDAKIRSGAAANATDLDRPRRCRSCTGS
jgi:hypothetical protein